MASSSAAARRSLRPHTAPNVRENLRKQKERLLARQAELEELAAPIHDVAAKLGKLDAIVESRSSAGQRKIEQLEKSLEKKIEKLRAEFAAKIEQVRQESDEASVGLTPQEQDTESALLSEYARAIVAFGDQASVAELASVLGVRSREAKGILEQARADVGDVEVAPTAESAGESESEVSAEAIETSENSVTTVAAAS